MQHRQSDSVVKPGTPSQETQLSDGRELQFLLECSLAHFLKIIVNHMDLKFQFQNYVTFLYKPPNAFQQFFEEEGI